jgi:hypothetical protein
MCADAGDAGKVMYVVQWMTDDHGMRCSVSPTHHLVDAMVKH